MLRIPLVSLRRHLLEAATLVLAAILCAVVANALASRERKLALVGNYPDALNVPKKNGDFSVNSFSRTDRLPLLLLTLK